MANAAAAADFLPVYEWHDGDGNYVLRLNLPGFKKEDFRVHVDVAGRLTVIGQRPADGAGAENVRLHKVFLLPPASNLDAITGRFDGSVLSLAVPKLPAPPAAGGEEEAVADKPPTGQKSKVGREAERLVEATMPRMAGKRREEAAADKSKVDREVERLIEATRARMTGKRKIEAARAWIAGKRKEEVKEQTWGSGKKPPAKKAGEATPEKALPCQKGSPHRDDQEEKRKAAAENKANVEHDAAAENKANVERKDAAENKANVERKAAAEHKANVEREAAERRIEASRTRLAMEREAETETETETEKKGSWKKQVEEEAVKLAEAIANHKEVIATAVAAFALGLFVSHKLFSRN